MAKKANINLIVLFLHDFGWPKPKAFHFGPNQLMIRYLGKKVIFISRYEILYCYFPQIFCCNSMLVPKEHGYSLCPVLFSFLSSYNTFPCQIDCLDECKKIPKLQRLKRVYFSIENRDLKQPKNCLSSFIQEQNFSSVSSLFSCETVVTG